MECEVVGSNAPLTLTLTRTRTPPLPLTLPLTLHRTASEAGQGGDEDGDWPGMWPGTGTGMGMELHCSLRGSSEIPSIINYKPDPDENSRLRMRPFAWWTRLWCMTRQPNTECTTNCNPNMIMVYVSLAE